jgi:hypothetical protein
LLLPTAASLIIRSGDYSISLFNFIPYNYPAERAVWVNCHKYFDQKAMMAGGLPE